MAPKFGLYFFMTFTFPALVVCVNRDYVSGIAASGTCARVSTNDIVQTLFVGCQSLMTQDLVLPLFLY